MRPSSPILALFLVKVLNDMTNKNGFETHGIERVSCSNVAKFRQAPSAWAVSYLKKERFTAGWAAWQGSAVEAGVDAGLYHAARIDECVEIALKELNELSIFGNNKAVEMEKRTPIVTRMVTTAMEQLSPLGTPDIPVDGKRQHEINIPVRFGPNEADTINCLGFLDYRWTEGRHKDNPLVVDLKTTSKSPSEFSLSHGIQAAVYERAVSIELKRPVEMKFLYVLTRQKDPFTWLTMEDGPFYLESFKKTVVQMEAFLSLSDDTDKLMRAIPHDPDTFYWRGGNAEELLQKYYS